MVLSFTFTGRGAQVIVGRFMGGVVFKQGKSNQLAEKEMFIVSA